MQNKKPSTNPVENLFVEWAGKAALWVGVFLASTGALGLWVYMAWNMALPPLGVRPLTYWQALGFVLFIALFLGMGLALKETREK